MISKSGAVKIIDFGIASSPDKTRNLTETGIVIGTPAYMSPEQLNDLKHADYKTDIFSMGVILYEMLTGKTPFGNIFSPEAISSRLSGKLNDPKKLNPEIPPAIKKVIKKSLNPSPAKRYKSISVPMKKLKRYYKRLSQKQVSENLSSYVDSGSFTSDISKARPVYPSFFASLKRSAKRKAVLISAILIIALTTGFFVFKNKIYLAMNSNKYGKLVIKYNYPMPSFRRLPSKKVYPVHFAKALERRKVFIQNHLKAYNNFIIRAKLYKTDEKGEQKNFVKYIEIIKKNYRNNAEGEKVLAAPDKYLVFKSKTLLVEKGLYYLQIQVNNQVHWTQFELKNIKQNPKPLVINNYFKNNPRRKVWFNFTFIDADSGDGITGTEIEILWAGRWFKWHEFIRNKTFLDNMLNGRNYYFRFKHSKYTTKKYRKIHAGLEQVVVNLNLRFQPKKSSVAINE